METPENRAAFQSASSLADACRDRQILEGRAVICDSSHNLVVDCGCMRGLIPREEGAIGMNDGSGRRPPEEFAALTQSIMADVRAKKPEAEFLLVSSICPNREACLYGNQEDYPAALAALCGNGTVLANVTAVHQELLKRKRYMDMTGNNVNHPNDYLHRIYAQVLMALTAPQL